MLQIILTLAIFVILVIPMGKYMYHIATKQKTFADKVFNPIDRCIYKVCGIKGEDMGWKKYALTLLLVNAVMVFVGYAILRLQSILFLNPNGISNMEPTLSFNTIISFMTNTNLQHYSGESGLSYVAQMCVIIFMMFTSAATGYAACMAFCRGLAGKKIGNFYEDMVRITTRILIPASFIVGLLLVSQGTPQTLQGNFTIETLEGNFQDIAVGPVAALESIKHLGRPFPRAGRTIAASPARGAHRSVPKVFMPSGSPQKSAASTRSCGQRTVSGASRPSAQTTPRSSPPFAPMILTAGSGQCTNRISMGAAFGCAHAFTAFHNKKAAGLMACCLFEVFG